MGNSQSFSCVRTFVGVELTHIQYQKFLQIQAKHPNFELIKHDSQYFLKQRQLWTYESCIQEGRITIPTDFSVFDSVTKQLETKKEIKVHTIIEETRD